MVEQYLYTYDLSSLDEAQTKPSPPEPYTLETYRPGMEDDWNEVHHAVFPDKKRHFNLKYVEDDRTVLLPDHFFFVYHEPTQEPVGINTAQVLITPGGLLANLDWIAVKPDHRGHKLGRLLMNCIHYQFNQDGFSTVSLRTADMESRRQAQSLYEQLNWKVVDKGPSSDMKQVQHRFAEQPQPLIKRLEESYSDPTNE